MSISSVLKESSRSDLAEILQLFKEFGCASIRNDVSEIYSPPRVVAMAARMGLKPGFALDLTIVDPDDGRPWDSDCADKRAKALAKVREEKPTLADWLSHVSCVLSLANPQLFSHGPGQGRRAAFARSHASSVLHQALLGTNSRRMLLPP